jgi:hypothetical protein
MRSNPRHRLAGYAWRKDPFSGILDPIRSQRFCSMLESLWSRCLIFSLDIMIVGSELQNTILSKLRRLEFDPDEVVSLASYTHCAPATDQA